MPIVEEFSDDEDPSDGIGFKIKNGSNKCVFVTLEAKDIPASLYSQTASDEVILNERFKMVFLGEGGNVSLYFGTIQSTSFGSNVSLNQRTRSMWYSPKIEPEAGNIYKLCLMPGSAKPNVELKYKVPASAKVRTGLKKGAARVRFGVDKTKKFLGLGEEIGNEYVGTSQFTSFSENIGGRAESPLTSIAKFPVRAYRWVANETVIKVFVNGEWTLDEKLVANGATFRLRYVDSGASKLLKLAMVGGNSVVSPESVNKNNIVYVNLTRLARGKTDRIFDIRNKNAGIYYFAPDRSAAQRARWERKVRERDVKTSYIGQEISFMTGEDYISEISEPAPQAYSNVY